MSPSSSASGGPPRRATIDETLNTVSSREDDAMASRRSLGRRRRGGRSCSTQSSACPSRAISWSRRSYASSSPLSSPTQTRLRRRQSSSRGVRSGWTREGSRLRKRMRAAPRQLPRRGRRRAPKGRRRGATRPVSAGAPRGVRSETAGTPAHRSETDFERGEDGWPGRRRLPLQRRKSALRRYSRMSCNRALIQL